MRKRLLLSILWVVALGWASMAQNLPEPIQPARFVNDYVGLFTTKQTQELEQNLCLFTDSTSTQIAVVIIDTLDGYPIEEYSERLANKWGIGQKGKDNGVLILLKPKKGQEKGEVRIEIGYGLEGAVPDAMASRIIRNEMIPQFQQNDYYQGVCKAVDALIALSKGEYKADDEEEQIGLGHWFMILIYIIIGITIFVAIMSIFCGEGSGSGGSSRGNYISYGNSSRRSCRGGGSFGGGGASGSW